MLLVILSTLSFLTCTANMHLLTVAFNSDRLIDALMNNSHPTHFIHSTIKLTSCMLSMLGQFFGEGHSPLSRPHPQWGEGDNSPHTHPLRRLSTVISHTALYALCSVADRRFLQGCTHYFSRPSHTFFVKTKWFSP